MENYGVKPLELKEKYDINGGSEPAEGSYGLGYAIGSAIRRFFSTLAKNYHRGGGNHIWGAS